MHRGIDPELRSTGFKRLSAALDPRELTRVAGTLQELLDEAGIVDGELVWATRALPTLRDDPLVDTCRDLAAELLGTKRPRLVFEHVIVRQPAGTASTGWHQDLAYFRRPVLARQVHLWVPVQRTPVEQGCLRYVPSGEAVGRLPHTTSPGSKALVTAIDEDLAVDCPVELGDVLAHLPTTPHAARANTSGLPRTSWTLQFR